MDQHAERQSLALISLLRQVVIEWFRCKPLDVGVTVEESSSDGFENVKYDVRVRAADGVTGSMLVLAGIALLALIAYLHGAAILGLVTQ